MNHFRSLIRHWIGLWWVSLCLAACATAVQPTPLPSSAETATTAVDGQRPWLLPIPTPANPQPTEPATSFTPIENSAQYLVVQSSHHLWYPDAQSAIPFRVSGFSFQGWHPNGQHLIFKSTDGQYRLFSLRTAELETVPELPDSVYPNWSADGQYVAFRTHNNQLAVLSPAIGQPELLPNAPAPQGQLIRWSPNGEYLSYFSMEYGDKPVPGYAIYDLTSKATAVVVDTLDFLTELGWSADGQWMGFSVWDSQRDYAQQISLQGMNMVTGQTWHYENHLGTMWLYGYWSPVQNRLLLTAVDPACGPTLPPGEGYYLFDTKVSSLELIDFDTGDIQQLTQLGADARCRDPQTGYSIGHSPWSPTGDRITYAVGQQLCFFDIALAEESCLAPLHTALLEAGYQGISQPSWSPDGEWIAFFLHVPEQYGAYVAAIRPDGTDLRVSSHLAYADQLIWAPLALEGVGSAP